MIPSPASANPVADLPRRVGLLGAIAVMAGIMIGSGIFRTPASIAAQTDSTAFILFAWLAGGLLSLAGALTYAELAVMFPRSGGVYVFLREGLGRPVAFVFGWTYLLVSKPLAAAGIAIIFADHVNRLCGASADPRLLTSIALVVLTIVNVVGVRQGAGLAVALTALKIAVLVGLVALGALLIPSDRIDPIDSPASPLAPRHALLALAAIMSAVMWTYDGWSDVGAIAGEVVNPSRTLPLAYTLGTLLVTALYLAVNAVYIAAVPLDQMRAMDTVAPAVTQALIGPAGATFLTAAVVVSAFGSTHGSILTGARISYAQARDGLLFQFLGRVHPRFETPAVSLWFQLALSLVATWTLGAFERLAGGFIFTMWIFYGMAACTIFILRRTRPDSRRDFRCPGYPVVPALFILASVAMTALSFAENPRDSALWLAILLAGIPVYFLWTRFAPAR